jgi:hypothetical protein
MEIDGIPSGHSHIQDYYIQRETLITFHAMGGLAKGKFLGSNIADEYIEY